MSVKTQGSALYFADITTTSIASVRKMTCPTGITGLGGARDQIEDTCLDNTDDKTYQAGLGNPGQVSVPFVFKPSAIDQQTLIEMKETGITTSWAIGFSDGSAAPTLDSNDEIVAAAGRTFALFTAYVADFNIDVATNEIVRGTLTLQRSGPVEWDWA